MMHSHSLSMVRHPDMWGGPPAAHEVLGRQLHGHMGTQAVSHTLVLCGLLPCWMCTDSACMGIRGGGMRLHGEFLGCMMSTFLDSLKHSQPLVVHPCSLSMKNPGMVCTFWMIQVWVLLWVLGSLLAVPVGGCSDPGGCVNHHHSFRVSQGVSQGECTPLEGVPTVSGHV